MIECYWHGETVGRLARNGASYVIDEGYTLNFPWLVLSWSGHKNEEVVGY